MANNIGSRLGARPRSTAAIRQARWAFFSLLVTAGLSTWPATLQAATPAVDAAGYPAQIKHDTHKIPISSKADSDTFVWAPKPDEIKRFELVEGLHASHNKNHGIILKGVTITKEGVWKLAKEARNPANAPANASVTIANSVEMTEEMAHEISTGLELSTSVTASIVVVEAEASATATFGYALTLASSETLGEEWSETVELKPGQAMQGWQRSVHVTVDFDTRTMFDTETEFQDALIESFAPYIFPGDVTREGSWAWFKANFPGDGARGIGLVGTNAPGYSFENFKKLGKIKIEYELPYPEFYPTYYDIATSN